MLIENSHLDGFVAENVAGCFDGGDVSGVVEDFEHDGTVELSGSILTELQLDQALGVQRLARAGVHFVLLDEGQDVQQVEYVTLQ